MRGGAKMGQVGSKKSKLISILSCDAGLKSPHIPVPPPLQGRKNLCGAKQGGMGQAKRGEIDILDHEVLRITKLTP